jgi:hypothetical protein
MVESLSQRDSNGQVAELMAKLRSVTEERDQLRRKLRSVRTALGSHDIRLDGSTEEEPVTREEQNSPPIAASVEERRAESTSDLATGFVDAAGETSTQKLALSPSLIFSSNPTPGHQNMPVLQPLEGDYAFSAPTVTCECSRQSEPFVQRQPLWQFANQTLSQNEALPTQTYQLEESLSDDMPIRALIQGWDVVENQLGAIATPSWKKLRFIDEILFRNCGFPERLAIMRMMYLQHRYSTNPSPHNQKSLPSWYLKRYVCIWTVRTLLICPAHARISLIHVPLTILSGQ